MILVDASVWIDHIRAPNDALERLLERGDVLTHSFIIGEIALCHVRRRVEFISELQKIQKSDMVDDAEVLQFIERFRLFGLGIGYVDAHILASTFLTPATRLWTKDRRLSAAAGKLGVAQPDLR